MASLNIPEPDVFEIPAKRPLNSPQAASWRSDRMANTGPQTPQGWAPPGGGGEASANKTMRWAQSIQQGAAKFAEGPGPNGITEGAKNLTGSIRDASAGATKTAMNLGAGAAKRIPLGAVLGAASEALPHSGVYTNGDDVPWQDRMRIGATDALAAGGGFLGGAAGAGVGQVALPIPGVGAVAGGLAGGVLGAQAGRWLGNKMFDSDGALQRAGYDPNRSVVDIGTDVASGKPLEEAMAPTMRAPVAPQRPAAPGLPGIGAVKDAQAPAPVSFADGAGGGFGARGRFAPNQVTPTGPGLVGQAPTTFAEGSDRGGPTIGLNPVTSSAPAASSDPTASFPANSAGQPGGTVPGAPSSPSMRANFLAGGGDGSPYQKGGDMGGGPGRKLPRDLSSLESGQVYKTVDPATGRTVYSGRDVKENASIVGADGAKTGQLSNNLRGDGIQVLDSQGRVASTQTPSSGFGQSGGFRANQPNSTSWPDMHIPSWEDRHQYVPQGSPQNSSGWAPGMDKAMRYHGAYNPANAPSNLRPDRELAVNEAATQFKAGNFYNSSKQSSGTSDFGPSLSTLSTSSMKPRDIRHAQDVAMQRANNQANIESATRLASMREGGDTARANLSANVQRENNAATTATQMYGHDIAAQGHLLSNDSARMRMRYDIGRDARDFAANRSDAAFTQGQQAVKDLHQEVAGMIPPTTDRDGKSVPDTENAARYAMALQASVGRLGGSMKDLDAKDKARFVAGMQLSDVASATATGGFTPWGTRAVQSNEPILALRKLPNGDYQTNRKGVNGETEVIPGRYIEKEGSIMGMGGRASNKFKALME